MTRLDSIRLRGVRVHNLRDVDVSIPQGRLTVITGVSGSGKSSLAFDALYAEGQRRYVECLSTYARQFLERVTRPQLERVENIPPALAIERKPLATQARSTVATVTEIHDYLRLLFARIGRSHCLGCGREVRVEDVGWIVERLLQRGGRAVVLFEVDVPSGRAAGELVRERVLRDGFRRIWREDGAEELEHARIAEGRLAVVVDRLALDAAARSRIADAIETAYRFGNHRCVVRFAEGQSERFSERLHCPDCDLTYRNPQPALFSPNSPLGACPDCRGFGRTIEPDLSRIVPDDGLTLAERPIDPWNKPAYRKSYTDLKRAGRKAGLRWDVPYRDLPDSHRSLIESGGSGFYGIRGFFDWLEKKTYKIHVRVFLSRYRAYVHCRRCNGRGLRPEALAVKVNGMDISEVVSWTIGGALEWVEKLKLPGAQGRVAARVLEELGRRLRFLDEVGVSYLALNRQSRTLSGGEAQRIQLARCLGSGLVGTLYVLDEPSIGLHPSEVDRLISVLRRLCDLGNTVVLVEHDPRVIRSADHLIDLGPGAGEQGGRVLYQGPVRGVAKSPESLTGAYLSGKLATRARRAAREPGSAGWLVLEEAATHNLQSVTVRFPKQSLSVVTGVSGSGKSSLVEDTLHGAVARCLGKSRVSSGVCRCVRGLEDLEAVDVVDQSPIGRSPRSNPATYVKAFNGIRRVLAATGTARARGLGPGFFSFNVAGGRCDKCEGAGSLKVEMHFLADLQVTCDACEGRRFAAAALEIRYKGLNVAEILDLTVNEAVILFADHPSVRSPLALLGEIGLGYLRLGQPAPTLSGGEAQRLKLVAHLGAGAGHRLLLLDEPTTGLHLHDLSVLVGLLRRLVDAGHTVIVVEHHLEMMLAADWIVDLGPGAGPAGGRLVAEGPPEQVARSAGPTGAYLAGALASPAHPTEPVRLSRGARSGPRRRSEPPARRRT